MPGSSRRWLLVVAVVLAGELASAGAGSPDGSPAAAVVLDGSAPDAGAPAPVTPAPEAPAVAPTAPPVIAGPATQQDSVVAAIKVIVGLLVLVVLAYLGGDRRVARFQDRLGITGIITAGFPFIALGLIASSSSVGILTGDVITRLRPVLHFGLGWLGFIIGAQLDIRVLDRVPSGTAYLILVETLGPFAITAAGCGGVMLAFGLSWRDPAVWRDVILLGAAAAMTAPRGFHGFANRTWREGRGADVLVGQLDELVGVVGLLFITAYFRGSTGSAWQLPGTAWVFVSLGLGVAIGVLIFAMIRVPSSNAEFLAVVLGAIAFSSGLAGYLHLSPIVISFLAGVLVTNFPNDQRASIFHILDHLERPVQLLFLIIAGALWDVGDWRGWALVPLFAVGRVLGKWTGMFASRTVVGDQLPAGFTERRQLVQPLSGLSIALVISVESLYRDPGLAWVVTAVIGGSLVTEVWVQATTTGGPPPPPPPIDELDDDDPIEKLIYRGDPDAPGGGA